MTITIKFITIEYGQNSKLSRLSWEDYPRCNVRKLSPIKNLNCIVNDVRRLLTRNHNINEKIF